MSYRPIGVVKSRLKNLDQAPKQGPEAGMDAVIELEPQWLQGLTGLTPGRWLWVICLFDRSGEPKVMVHPRGDHSRPKTGMFNTRSPHRPNPLSLTLVKLVAVDGPRLSVRGLEMLDGTPVVDIKPWVEGVDQPRKGE
ncbi:MAG: tRNA (N6-threonylcarbamoyladenosine(37)-N6)-methyltransferase TrmO [Desulfarculaceae bacterium]|nr:tRNA (N6-threonylcarbamoyladenosine(37)-N6)-methyltransferase TrmO [Desulfarculaceae bacterium]